MRLNRRKDGRGRDFSAALIAGVILLVLPCHYLSRNITSGDSVYTVHTAMSMIREGNLALDEYAEEIRARPDQLYTVTERKGHLFYAYPVGGALLSIPVIFFLDRALPTLIRSFPSIEHQIRTRMNLPAGRIDPISIHPLVEVFTASTWVALTAACLFLVARSAVSPGAAALVALLFSFGTAAWSSASRALWPHAPSMFMLAATLLILIRSKTRRHRIWLAAFPLALAFFIRPTNLISIVLFTAYVFFHFRPYFWRYAAVLGGLLGIQLLISVGTYGTLVSPTYLSQGVTPGSNFAEGLLGVLISPSRGLLIFSPILLFSLFGVALKIRSKRLEALDTYLLAILVCHWVMIGSFPRWWGGWSFGPRYFSDVLPYLIFFLLPALGFPESPSRTKKLAYRGVLLTFAAFGFFVHLRGATQPDVILWNSRPASIDLALERLWDWKDPQFLRGFGNEHGDFSYQAKLEKIGFSEEPDLRYTIRVSNTGTCRWRRKTNQILRVGCRVFQDRGGATPVLELRDELPKASIKPGEAFESEFTLKKEILGEGGFKIEFNLLRENVFWFDAIGSESLIDRIVITPAPQGGSGVG